MHKITLIYSFAKFLDFNALKFESIRLKFTKSTDPMCL